MLRIGLSELLRGVPGAHTYTYTCFWPSFWPCAAATGCSGACRPAYTCTCGSGSGKGTTPATSTSPTSSKGGRGRGRGRLPHCIVQHRTEEGVKVSRTRRLAWGLQLARSLPLPLPMAMGVGMCTRRGRTPSRYPSRSATARGRLRGATRAASSTFALAVHDDCRLTVLVPPWCTPVCARRPPAAVHSRRQHFIAIASATASIIASRSAQFPRAR